MNKIIFLIKINDRMYGFRVVAVVGASTPEEALEFCVQTWRGTQITNTGGMNYARVIDSCPIIRDRITYAEMEHEE